MAVFNPPTSPPQDLNLDFWMAQRQARAAEQSPQPMPPPWLNQKFPNKTQPIPGVGGVHGQPSPGWMGLPRGWNQGAQSFSPANWNMGGQGPGGQQVNPINGVPWGPPKGYSNPGVPTGLGGTGPMAGSAPGKGGGLFRTSGSGPSFNPWMMQRALGGIGSYGGYQPPSKPGMAGKGGQGPGISQLGGPGGQKPYQPPI